MNTTNNLHVLKIKWLGITKTQPARVKVISERFNEFVIIPFTNEPTPYMPAHVDSAVKWLYDRGFIIVGMGNGVGHDYVITETLKSLKEK